MNIRKSAIVKIFDWGRSEFNHAAIMQELSEAEIEDRKSFWSDYRHSTINFLGLLQKSTSTDFVARNGIHSPLVSRF